jgi:hypothetical protein
MLTATVFAAFEPVGLFIMIPCSLITFYFLFSSLFGYVELRENSVYIKLGFFIKRDIPYDTILAVNKERRFYSESMLSLKNALEHVNIKYNKFDVITVSVKGNDELIAELENRMRK